MDEMQSYLCSGRKLRVCPSVHGRTCLEWIRLCPYGRAGRAGGQRRGDFNDWDHLEKSMENHGSIWTVRIPGVKQYATYKYAICGPTG